ncbi:hypothetical protein [Rufibacter roseus]|uniref:Lipoprotein n=1 Tax=Rufibacter roseus TaxID=1567108 RepID=A0ABW2DH71_9BACT|nr:hypothetical protein [Rufibacter roseus]
MKKRIVPAKFGMGMLVVAAGLVASGCSSEGKQKEGGVVQTASADSLRSDQKDSAVVETNPTQTQQVEDSTHTFGTILPNKRIIAYYGNPLSKRMGILGELPPEQMLARLDEEVKAWEEADPATPVQPALHVIMLTAQGKPLKSNTYSLRMSGHVADSVISWAKTRNAIVFLDIQIGKSTFEKEIPHLEKYLKLPQVHLGIDPEFAMKKGGIPGGKIGTVDAEDINYATGYLSDLATKHNLPPKILVVHRFTQGMVTNYKNIKIRPNVQIVMHMDGWGDKPLKRDSYRAYIKKEPVQFTGFKIFYKNDTKKPGWKLFTPEELLKLDPVPHYIQYQ